MDHASWSFSSLSPRSRAAPSSFFPGKQLLPGKAPEPANVLQARKEMAQGQFSLAAYFHEKKLKATEVRDGGVRTLAAEDNRHPAIRSLPKDHRHPSSLPGSSLSDSSSYLSWSSSSNSSASSSSSSSFASFSASSYLALSNVLPCPSLVEAYRETRGITALFPWQFDCLSLTRTASPFSREAHPSNACRSPQNEEARAARAVATHGLGAASPPVKSERTGNETEGDHRRRQAPRPDPGVYVHPATETAPLESSPGLQLRRHPSERSHQQAASRAPFPRVRRVIDGGLNLLYSAPTSAGKSLVAEILVFRHALGLLGHPLRVGKRSGDSGTVLPFPTRALHLAENEDESVDAKRRRVVPLPETSSMTSLPPSEAASESALASCSLLPSLSSASSSTAFPASSSPPRRAAVIVLPFVALVEEQFSKLQALASASPSPLKVVAFHHGSPTPLTEAFDVALCTIEKANALIQALLEENALAEKIGIVVVDELHMVGDAQRGFLLEVFLSKLLCFNQRRAALEAATLNRAPDAEEDGGDHGGIEGRDEARTRKRRRASADIEAEDAQTAPGGSRAPHEAPESPLTASSLSPAPRLTFWPVQIVGMSATLGNLDEVARWLSGVSFVSSHRPLPLREFYFCWDKSDPECLLLEKASRPSASPAWAAVPFPSEEKALLLSQDEEGSPPTVASAPISGSGSCASRSSRRGPRDSPQFPPRHAGALLSLSLHRVRRGDSVLVFCPTKVICEKVSAFLAPRLEAPIASSFSPSVSTPAALSPSSPSSSPSSSSSFYSSFADSAEGVREARSLRAVLLSRLAASEGGSFSLSPALASCFLAGVAFHHSGLTSFERRAVEKAYRDGLLLVLCATSTLAAGVNLPAKRVIFFSPFIGRNFLAAGEYKQMAGRAGRVGALKSRDARDGEAKTAPGYRGQGGRSGGCGVSSGAVQTRRDQEARRGGKRESAHRARESEDGEQGRGGDGLAERGTGTEEDEGGEAIVLCREVEEEAVKRVMSAGLPVLESPLAAERHGLQRLLLEALACGGEDRLDGFSKATVQAEQERESERQNGKDKSSLASDRPRGWFGGTCSELVLVASCTLLMIQRHRHALCATPSGASSASLPGLSVHPSSSRALPRRSSEASCSSRAASHSRSSSALPSPKFCPSRAPPSAAAPASCSSSSPTRCSESPRATLQQSPVYRDVKAAMEFLLERGLARFSSFRDAYEATPKGRAIAASQLAPQEGFLTCALLDRLVDKLVLSNDLHLAYLSVPLPSSPPPPPSPFPACFPSSSSSPVSSPPASSSGSASCSPSASSPSLSGAATPSLCPETYLPRSLKGETKAEGGGDPLLENDERRIAGRLRRKEHSGHGPLQEEAGEAASAVERDGALEARERARLELDGRQAEDKKRDERMLRFKREREELAFALSRRELQTLQKVLKAFSPAESFALAQLGLSEVDVENLDAPGFLQKHSPSDTSQTAIASSQSSSSAASSASSSLPRPSLCALQGRRFFIVWRVRQALALCLLLQGLEPKAVAATLAVSGGLSAVSLLHQQATLKAAMTGVLCTRLGLWSLAEFLKNFQTRLQHSGLGLHLAPILRLGVAPSLARLLHDQLGVCTPQQLLAVGPARVAKVLRRRLKLNLGRAAGKGSHACRGRRSRAGLPREKTAPMYQVCNGEETEAPLASFASARSPRSPSFSTFFQADRAAAEVTADLFSHARTQLLAEVGRAPRLYRSKSNSLRFVPVSRARRLSSERGYSCNLGPPRTLPSDVGERETTGVVSSFCLSGSQGKANRVAAVRLFVASACFAFGTQPVFPVLPPFGIFRRFAWTLFSRHSSVYPLCNQSRFFSCTLSPKIYQGVGLPPRASFRLCVVFLIFTPTLSPLVFVGGREASAGLRLPLVKEARPNRDLLCGGSAAHSVCVSRRHGLPRLSRALAAGSKGKGNAQDEGRAEENRGQEARSVAYLEEVERRRAALSAPRVGEDEDLDAILAADEARRRRLAMSLGGSRTREEAGTVRGSRGLCGGIKPPAGRTQSECTQKTDVDILDLAVGDSNPGASEGGPNCLLDSGPVADPRALLLPENARSTESNRGDSKGGKESKGRKERGGRGDSEGSPDASSGGGRRVGGEEISLLPACPSLEGLQRVATDWLRLQERTDQAKEVERGDERSEDSEPRGANRDHGRAGEGDESEGKGDEDGALSVSFSEDGASLREAFVGRAQSAVAEGRFFAVFHEGRQTPEGKSPGQGARCPRTSFQDLPGFCIPEEFLLPVFVGSGWTSREKVERERESRVPLFSRAGSSRVSLHSSCAPVAARQLLDLVEKSPFLAVSVLHARRRKREITHKLSPRQHSERRQPPFASFSSPCPAAVPDASSGTEAKERRCAPSRLRRAREEAAQTETDEDDALVGNVFSQRESSQMPSESDLAERTHRETVPLGLCLSSPFFGTFLVPLGIATALFTRHSSSSSSPASSSSSSSSPSSSSCASASSTSAVCTSASSCSLSVSSLPRLSSLASLCTPQKCKRRLVLVRDRHAWLEWSDGLAGEARGRTEENASETGEKEGEKGVAAEARMGGREAEEAHASVSEGGDLRGTNQKVQSLISLLRNATAVDVKLPHLLLKRRAPPSVLQRAEAELLALRKHEREEDEAESQEAYLLGLWGSKVLVSARLSEEESASQRGTEAKQTERQLDSFETWERRRTAWIHAVSRQLDETRGGSTPNADAQRRERERAERRRIRRIEKAIALAVEANWRRICASAVLAEELRQHGLLEVYLHLEAPLARVVNAMARRGLPVDSAFLTSQADRFRRLLHALQLHFCRLAGSSVDPLSEASLAAVLLHVQQSLSHMPCLSAPQKMLSSPFLSGAPGPRCALPGVANARREASGKRGGGEAALEGNGGRGSKSGCERGGGKQSQDEGEAQLCGEREGEARGSSTGVGGGQTGQRAATKSCLGSPFSGVAEDLSQMLTKLVVTVNGAAKDDTDDEPDDDLLAMLLRRLDPFSPFATALLAFFGVYVHLTAVQTLLAEMQVNRSLGTDACSCVSSSLRRSQSAQGRRLSRSLAPALDGEADKERGEIESAKMERRAETEETLTLAENLQALRRGGENSGAVELRLPVRIQEWENAAGRLLPEHPYALRKLHALVHSPTPSVSTGAEGRREDGEWNLQRRNVSLQKSREQESFAVNTGACLAEDGTTRFPARLEGTGRREGESLTAGEGKTHRRADSCVSGARRDRRPADAVGRCDGGKRDEEGAAAGAGESGGRQRGETQHASLETPSPSLDFSVTLPAWIDPHLAFHLSHASQREVPSRQKPEEASATMREPGEDRPRTGDAPSTSLVHPRRQTQEPCRSSPALLARAKGDEKEGEKDGDGQEDAEATGRNPQKRREKAKQDIYTLLGIPLVGPEKEPVRVYVHPRRPPTYRMDTRVGGLSPQGRAVFESGKEPEREERVRMQSRVQAETETLANSCVRGPQRAPTNRATEHKTEVQGREGGRDTQSRTVDRLAAARPRGEAFLLSLSLTDRRREELRVFRSSFLRLRVSPPTPFLCARDEGEAENGGAEAHGEGRGSGGGGAPFAGHARVPREDGKGTCRRRRVDVGAMVVFLDDVKRLEARLALRGREPSETPLVEKMQASKSARRLQREIERPQTLSETTRPLPAEREANREGRGRDDTDTDQRILSEWKEKCIHFFPASHVSRVDAPLVLFSPGKPSIESPCREEEEGVDLRDIAVASEGRVLMAVEVEYLELLIFTYLAQREPLRKLVSSLLGCSSSASASEEERREDLTRLSALLHSLLSSSSPHLWCMQEPEAAGKAKADCHERRGEHRGRRDEVFKQVLLDALQGWLGEAREQPFFAPACAPEGLAFLQATRQLMTVKGQRRGVSQRRHLHRCRQILRAAEAEAVKCMLLALACEEDQDGPETEEYSEGTDAAYAEKRELGGTAEDPQEASPPAVSPDSRRRRHSAESLCWRQNGRCLSFFPVLPLSNGMLLEVCAAHREAIR
ncbi:hypothetical protein NCLIV_017360 [Neospora caninum Liverpool]|uniref:DEAD/DEAH box helicase domain-containing protein n=1 Tax=Neospora caninum (strain Liverpool) TaxID=572307 RepID=F0VE01_NEOCL|nr:hypothetical protein NCLIV_017360 [Neospora caninum Liverpool]CBZ51944.1 hypothetical protein NCLIV_017360 [Neospora caninum Liverpool]|eukprot:XP_003881977.1 hypothetical protein NCLIV_017360 [Neospora caninum Liverpool]